MNKLKKYINKNYLKDNQKLLLETWYDVKFMKKRKQYFSQEIVYKNYSLCKIQTWDILKYNENISYTPYCIKNEWGSYTVTVPKFGQLTEKDIEKAVRYVLKKFNLWSIFNIKLDGKNFKYSFYPEYKIDIENLRWIHEKQ